MNNIEINVEFVHDIYNNEYYKYTICKHVTDDTNNFLFSGMNLNISDEDIIIDLACNTMMDSQKIKDLICNNYLNITSEEFDAMRKIVQRKRKINRIT